MTHDLLPISENFQKIFEAILPLTARRKSPELMLKVFGYVVKKYQEVGLKQGSEIFVSIPSVAKYCNVSWNTAEDCLQALVDLGIMGLPSVGEGRSYNRQYKFPNKTIVNSFLAPFERINVQSTEWMETALSEAEMIRSSSNRPVSPIVQLTHQEFYSQGRYLIEASKDAIRISSNTPGVIIASERGGNKSPNRNSYFELLEKVLKTGKIKVKYLFNYDATLEALKNSKKDAQSAKELFVRYNRLLEVRYFKSVVFPGAIMTDSTILLGVKDESTDEAHATRGLLISEEFLVKYFNTEFQRLWDKNAKAVNMDTIADLVRLANQSRS